MMDMYGLELRLMAEGISPVCGIDEAGRGPLAGPVCAACVILDPLRPIEGLNDSKKLSEKKRDALFAEITEKAVAYGIAFATVEEIEQVNILNATFLAMKRAFDSLPVKPAIALVDGNKEPGFGIATQCIVGGDGKCACIAAASILAKVTRDRYMREMDGKYPVYGFGVHKGYGTVAHYAAIREHGICDIHRRSFLKKYFAGNSDEQ